jgi:CubicO group peptidase (beta-lactamase class C family)
MIPTIAAARTVFFSGLVILTGWMFTACQPAREPLEEVVIDSDEIRHFADEFFAENMEALHIPGLVFVFVQGGEVLYAQGYGWADIESGTPMRSDSSIVSIASVSKPFVAIAVM